MGGIRVKGGVGALLKTFKNHPRLDLVADDATEADRTDEEIDECGGDIFFGF